MELNLNLLPKIEKGDFVNAQEFYKKYGEIQNAFEMHGDQMIVSAELFKKYWVGQLRFEENNNGEIPKSVETMAKEFQRNFARVTIGFPEDREKFPKIRVILTNEFIK